MLGGVAIGEDAAGLGAAAVAGVEQYRFLDACQRVEQCGHGQVEVVLVGVAPHQERHGEGEDAVEGVHADLLLGPVVHGAERDDVGVFELAESELGVGLDR